MYNDTPLSDCIDVPTMIQIASKTKNMKKRRVAGVILDDMVDIKALCLKMRMPAFDSALQLPEPLLQPGALVTSERGPLELRQALAKVGATLAIPQDQTRYSVHGQCFTGPVQIGWVIQLLGMPNRFVLHVDGKHKLHHGGFVLLTIGTHFLRWDVEHMELRQSFAPLVYLMCKEQETNGAVQILVDALSMIAVQYGGADLQPGATMSDNSDAIRNALVSKYGKYAQHGSCYPHITRKVCTQTSIVVCLCLVNYSLTDNQYAMFICS